MIAAGRDETGAHVRTRLWQSGTPPPRLRVFVLFLADADAAAGGVARRGAGVRGARSWSSVPRCPLRLGRTRPLSWPAGILARLPTAAILPAFSGRPRRRFLYSASASRLGGWSRVRVSLRLPMASPATDLRRPADFGGPHPSGSPRMARRSCDHTRAREVSETPRRSRRD